jgi:hypothetical protein
MATLVVVTESLTTAAKELLALKQLHSDSVQFDSDEVELLERLSRGVRKDCMSVSLSDVMRVSALIATVPASLRGSSLRVGVRHLLQGSSLYVPPAPEKPKNPEYERRIAALRASRESQQYAELVSDITTGQVCAQKEGILGLLCFLRQVSVHLPSKRDSVPFRRAPCLA